MVSEAQEFFDGIIKIYEVYRNWTRLDMVRWGLVADRLSHNVAMWQHHKYIFDLLAEVGIEAAYISYPDGEDPYYLSIRKNSEAAARLVLDSKGLLVTREQQYVG